MLHATSSVPCEQRFLFCIPLLASTKSLTSLVHGREVGLFFSVQGENKPTTRLTSDANDFVNAKALLAGYL